MLQIHCGLIYSIVCVHVPSGCTYWFHERFYGMHGTTPSFDVVFMGSAIVTCNYVAK